MVVRSARMKLRPMLCSRYSQITVSRHVDQAVFDFRLLSVHHASADLCAFEELCTHAAHLPADVFCSARKLHASSAAPASRQCPPSSAQCTTNCSRTRVLCVPVFNRSRSCSCRTYPESKVCQTCPSATGESSVYHCSYSND